MAFTRSWDETDPDGSIVAAEDIDREIRELKIDIRERLDDVSTFGSDTDPLELTEEAVASKVPIFYGIYDDDQTVGNKVTSEGRGKFLVAIRVAGQTDGAGNITVDLDEFNEDLTFVETAVHVAIYGTGSPANGLAVGPSHSVAGNTVTLTFYDSAAGTTINSQNITFTLLAVAE